MRVAIALLSISIVWSSILWGQQVAPGALEYAVMHRQSFVVGRLLRQGADPNQIGSGGSTPIADAALKADVDIVQVLLRFGAKVDIVSRDGTLPIHDAALGGHPQVIQDILTHGGKVNAKTRDGGQTPLHIAAENGKFKAAPMLLGYDADPTIKDAKGRTPLDTAERAGAAEIVALLRKALADVK